MTLESVVISLVLAAAMLLLIRHFRRQWKDGGVCRNCTRSCNGCGLVGPEAPPEKKPAAVAGDDDAGCTSD